MKKLSAFTLVELLIVIVIIGILMSALLPRLSGAQDIARDTSRQVAVNQLYTAIMSYKSLHGKWPAVKGVTGCVESQSGLQVLVNEGLLTEVPQDPNSYEVRQVKNGSGSDNVVVTGGYIFCVTSKNKSKKAGGFILAKTETPAKSNYVGAVDDNSISATGIYEFNDLFTCNGITKSGEDNKKVTFPKKMNDENCTYGDNQNLFYILKF